MALSHDLADRRAAPRFSLIAQANVVSGGEVYLLTVRNISAAGAFLEGRPRDHADLVPGAEIEVVISAEAPGMGDDDVINIDCRGHVARIELKTASSPGGFGVSLEPKTNEDQERLEDLLSRLIELPPDQRPVTLG